MCCVSEFVVFISCVCYVFFFFKQKTAYEMRISDWSSDVCSSDLARDQPGIALLAALFRTADGRHQKAFEVAFELQFQRAFQAELVLQMLTPPDRKSVV